MYTKLFSHITDSTVWQEDDQTRIVWITMLAMSDREGYVRASIPGLAGRARVPLESVEQALEKLSSPDKYSQTQEHEGRRIQKLDGGWFILNYVKYRDIQKAEERREYMRIYQQERRAEVKKVNSGKFTVNRVNTSEADTDKTLTPLTPLSGGNGHKPLSPRERAKLEKVLRQIAKAMEGADYDLGDALRKAAERCGVSWDRAKEMLVSGG